MKVYKEKAGELLTLLLPLFGSDPDRLIAVDRYSYERKITTFQSLAFAIKCSFFIIWECALWHYLVLTGHYLEPKTQVLTTVWKLSLAGTLSAGLLCSDAHLHLGFFVSVIYFAVWFVGMIVGFSITFVKDKCQKHRWNRSWQAGTSNKWAFQIYRARLQQQAEPLLYCTTKAFGKGDSPGDISV